MSCKHHRHAKEQEERIRNLEYELEIAREEIGVLKTGNRSSGIREQNYSESWCKPKNSKSRCCRFSADDAVVELSNRFSMLKTDTVNVHQHNQVPMGQVSKKIKSVPDITGRKIKFYCWAAVTLLAPGGREENHTYSNVTHVSPLNN
jgi:hypothetical protein